MKYIATSFIILLFGVIGILNPVRDVTLTLTAPIQFGLHQSAVASKDFVNFVLNIKSVWDDKLSMQEEIISLNAELLEMQDIRKENELLKEQLEIKAIDKDKYELLLVNVMGNPVDLTSGTIILDKGSSNGISAGDNVIRASNIVGIVRNVTLNRAYVELITSPNMSFTVYNLDSKEKTEALGVGKYGSSINLERILPNERIMVGDSIATSGKDGTYLPNFLVGKVSEVKDDPSQPLKSATVVTYLNFAKLDKVFVVISKK